MNGYKIIIILEMFLIGNYKVNVNTTMAHMKSWPQRTRRILQNTQILVWSSYLIVRGASISWSNMILHSYLCVGESSIDLVDRNGDLSLEEHMTINQVSRDFFKVLSNGQSC